MSEYKLVPFEPTPEMVVAAEDAYMPFGDMDLALRMAVLAAPAVQGEPTGQKPAPDVGALVEALERAHMALIGYLPGHRNDITDAAISQCEQVLTAYRKGGDTP